MAERYRSPIRTAIGEAIRDEPDPFGALVDLAERLDIDVVLLVTATIETEVLRRVPALKMPGRKALDATDAEYLLWLLMEYRKAAEAAASSDKPEAAALVSLREGRSPDRPDDLTTAARLAEKIKNRPRAALAAALEVLREEEPDLVRILVGKRTATAARKRLRALSERDTEDRTNRKWLDVKSLAAEVLRPRSRG